MMKRIITAIIACTLTFSVIPAYAFENSNSEKISEFTDVNVSYWYCKDVQFIVNYGLMNGESSEKFNPNGVLTNAQVAQIFYNSGVKHKNVNEFIDIYGNEWYYNAVMECGEYFPVHWNRYEGGAMFLPNSPISRQELCYTILRASGLSDEDIISQYESKHGQFEQGWRAYPEAALQLMVDMNIITGYGNGDYGGNDSLTRAQCAAILNRVISLYGNIN